MAWVSASTALALLGVRAQTLYANVSRGRIRAKPDPADPRRSLYHGGDVERLAARRAGRRKSAAVAAEAIDWGEPILASALSTVAQGRPWYRGRDVVQLAETGTLEEVAALLWEVDRVTFPSGEAACEDDGTTALSRALRALSCRVAEDIPLPGRARGVLAGEAAGLVGLLARAMGVAESPSPTPLHIRLASAWKADAAADGLRRALVLLADHELNASTFAARVTASTGAPLAGCMIAGLATLSGPLHGGAAAGVHLLVEATRRRGAAAAVRDWLSQGRPLPAFGHPLYPAGDPRAGALLSYFEPSPAFAALREAVEAATGERPNVDFALAALADARDLPADAGFIIFALARSVGWIAHALEQTATGQLIRPRARYVGPPLDKGQITTISDPVGPNPEP